MTEQITLAPTYALQMQGHSLIGYIPNNERISSGDLLVAARQNTDSFFSVKACSFGFTDNKFHGYVKERYIMGSENRAYLWFVGPTEALSDLHELVVTPGSMAEILPARLPNGLAWNSYQAETTEYPIKDLDRLLDATEQHVRKHHQGVIGRLYGRDEETTPLFVVLGNQGYIVATKPTPELLHVDVIGSRELVDAVAHLVPHKAKILTPY